MSILISNNNCSALYCLLSCYSLVPGPSECQIRRNAVVQASENDLKFALSRVDVHVMKCTEFGQFDEIQCWPWFGTCWCVDQDGNEVAGTKTNSSRPKCPKRWFDRCLLLSFNLSRSRNQKKSSLPPAVTCLCIDVKFHIFSLYFPHAKSPDLHASEFSSSEIVLYNY